jgi:hypothetical protein
VHRPDRPPQRGRRAVGIALPGQGCRRRVQGLTPCLRRGVGRLVGVQPNPYLDLGGVVPLQRS